MYKYFTPSPTLEDGKSWWQLKMSKSFHLIIHRLKHPEKITQQCITGSTLTLLNIAAGLSLQVLLWQPPIWTETTLRPNNCDFVFILLSRLKQRITKKFTGKTSLQPFWEEPNNLNYKPILERYVIWNWVVRNFKCLLRAG